MIRALKSLKDLPFDWSLLCKVYNVWPKKKEHGLENDMRNFAIFHQNTLKCQKLVLSWDPFCPKYKIHEVKIYRRVMRNDNEEWWKIWRGIDLSFQNWHKELDKFRLDHLSLDKLHFNGLLKKYRRVIFHDNRERCKIWKKTDFRNLKNDIRNLTKFHRSTRSLKIGTFIRSFYPK